MNRENNWGFDWSELITGIIFLIAGYFVLRLPQIAITSLAVVFAIAAIVRGITTIGGYHRLKQVTGMRATFALILGILDIIVGAIFMFDIPSAVTVLGFLFAVWFLIDVLERLLVSSHLKIFGRGIYWLSVGIDLVLLILAILLLMRPILTVLAFNALVGTSLIIFGLNAIVIAFARRIK
ncbi:HdeD family acid-resistance protein [Pediococcus siamensis]|uniref:HdeD family acid-resistance protein n=1 Tax=Pediococcus siamensis TaxID=381829 RepID=UPI00399FC5A7